MVENIPVPTGYNVRYGLLFIIVAIFGLKILNSYTWKALSLSGFELFWNFLALLNFQILENRIFLKLESQTLHQICIF